MTHIAGTHTLPADSLRLSLLGQRRSSSGVGPCLRLPFSDHTPDENGSTVIRLEPCSSFSACPSTADFPLSARVHLTVRLEVRFKPEPSGKKIAGSVVSTTGVCE